MLRIYIYGMLNVSNKVVESTSPDCLGYRSGDLRRLKGRRQRPVVLQRIDPSGFGNRPFYRFWQLINYSER